MAIQVGGTTVIDNTPNLVNVGGLKTVGGTSILGSGDISVGGSTTYGDVGTYVMAYGAVSSGYSAGDTVAGSTLSRVVVNSGYDRGGYNIYNASSGSFSNVALSLTSPDSTTSLGLSGTWRAMTNGGLGRTGYHQGHLWVRVS